MQKIIALTLLVISLSAQAGVVLYGTRVIYPAEKRDIVVQVMNQGERSSLVQSWIDDGDTSRSPENIDVPFLLTPPVVKVAGNSGQQIKIIKMPNTLAQDRESLFFLNVLSIPPNDAQNSSKNVIKFALQNRIKLFWRPTGIAPVSRASFRQISLSYTGREMVIKNDNANWITLTDIKVNDVKVNGETVMLPPRAYQTITLKNNNAPQYSLTIIDDHGNYISDRINVK